MITEQIVASKEKSEMGRVSAKFEVANNEDLIAAKLGHIPAEKVRRMQLEGIVDTGATRLVLPESVTKQLGLTSEGKVTVRYADERRTPRSLVGNVWLECLGRHSIFSAVVEPARTVPLIGAIVLEDLDLLVDCTTQQLRPRDPNTIISEAE